MKKNRLVNIIAFGIGIYLIIRSFFWFTYQSGNPEENKFYAIIFLSLGILAIAIQLIANYIKNKKQP